MITAGKLRLLTTYSVEGLAVALFNSGKKGALDIDFTEAKFIGMTNATEFCYRVVRMVEDGTKSAKVFLKYDPTEDRVTASIT